MNKSIIPAEQELEAAIGNTYPLWTRIRNDVLEKYPAAREEWNFPGKKYGWTYRMKDKRRAILYLLPRQEYFEVAFVFGEKASRQILESEISQQIKNELKNARAYAEGRGIRLEVRNEAVLNDIQKLVEIKLGLS